MSNKAVVILSGGMDSSTVLAQATQSGYECYAITFDYGQRNRAEINASKRVAEFLNVKEHLIFKIDLSQFGGSALTDTSLEIPTEYNSGIPITYVPARNTIFLSIALSWAESLGAYEIFYGANIVDYSGYPDCRPDYIAAFQLLANLATKAGVEDRNILIRAPLLNLSKDKIIKMGLDLGLDYGLTVSCYAADEDGRACGKCDSCRFRAKGFAKLNQPDPTSYVDIENV